MSTNQSVTPNQATDWPELAIGLYDRLTGRGTAINYEMRDMVIEVPQDTRQDSPRATWRVNGTLRITTDEPGK